MAILRSKKYKFLIDGGEEKEPEGEERKYQIN
jgi:hypothetical protein